MVDSFFEPRKRSKSPQFLRPLENVEKSTVFGTPRKCRKVHSFGTPKIWPQKWPFFRMVDSHFRTSRDLKISKLTIIMASFLSIGPAKHIFTPLEIKSQTKAITSNNYYDLFFIIFLPKVQPHRDLRLSSDFTMAGACFHRNSDGRKFMVPRSVSANLRNSSRNFIPQK